MLILGKIKGVCVFHLERLVVICSLFLVQATPIEALACQIERGLSPGFPCARAYPTGPGEAAGFYLCFGPVEI